MVDTSTEVPPARALEEANQQWAELFTEVFAMAALHPVEVRTMLETDYEPPEPGSYRETLDAERPISTALQRRELDDDLLGHLQMTQKFIRTDDSELARSLGWV